MDSEPRIQRIGTLAELQALCAVMEDNAYEALAKCWPTLSVYALYLSGHPVLTILATGRNIRAVYGRDRTDPGANHQQALLLAIASGDQGWSVDPNAKLGRHGLEYATGMLSPELLAARNRHLQRKHGH